MGLLRGGDAVSIFSENDLCTLILFVHFIHFIFLLVIVAPRQPRPGLREESSILVGLLRRHLVRPPPATQVVWSTFLYQRALHSVFTPSLATVGKAVVLASGEIDYDPIC